MFRIGVVGAGTMGHGIAQVFATAGFDVRLYDTTERAIDLGIEKIVANLSKLVELGKLIYLDKEKILARLHRETSLEALALNSELVIEAIPELLPLKKQLFSALENHNSSLWFATNTSSLSVGEMATALSKPERLIGTHFFNPVPRMPLLEIIVTSHTHPELLDWILKVAPTLGKETIIVNDFPGFATSRLGVCLGMEAIRMVEQGVASPEDIDKAMVLGYRHPIGPLRLTDLVGLDVRMNIGRYLAKELDNSAFEPPRLMVEMVQAGKLGQKSGVGFYHWNEK